MGEKWVSRGNIGLSEILRIGETDPRENMRDFLTE